MKKILGLLLVCTIGLLTSTTVSAADLDKNNLIVVADDLGVDYDITTPVVLDAPTVVVDLYVGESVTPIPLYATNVNVTESVKANYTYTDDDVGWCKNDSNYLSYNSVKNYKDLPLLVPLE